MQGRALTAKYDGYASCPLLVGDGKAILAEFIYGGIPQEVQSDPRIPCAFVTQVHRRLLAVSLTKASPGERFIISRKTFSQVLPECPFRFFNCIGAWYSDNLRQKPIGNFTAAVAGTALRDFCPLLFSVERDCSRSKQRAADLRSELLRARICQPFRNLTNQQIETF